MTSAMHLHHLDGAVALGFVETRLSLGNSLAHRIRSELPLEEFKFRAIAPPGVPASRLEKFSTGGLCCSADSEAFLGELVSHCICSGDATGALFENSLAQPGDPVLTRRTSTIRFHGSEVLHVLSRTNAERDRVVSALREARSAHLFIGATFSDAGASDALQSSIEISDTTLDRVVESVSVVVVDAYDGESFLLCGRS